MSEAVTSGLGRNGPWLQNRWLRVESRLDDGSIAPLTLDGAFCPTERALAFARLTDGTQLNFERCDYGVAAHDDILGPGRRLTMRSRNARRAVTLTRDVVLYDERPYALTRVGLTNEASKAVPLGSLHAFTTRDNTRGRLRLQSRPSDLRIYRNGWQSWSPTMSLGGQDRDLRSRPPELAPEIPLEEPGTFASDDLGVLFDPASDRSFLVGVATARQFLSQVFVDVPSKALDARNACDDVAVSPGETRWSEWFLVDLIGHPNDQLARYGDALGAMMGARIPARTPTGWCSWYYFYTTVTEDDVLRNLRFLATHRSELPIETMQIDDGYQADIGDWLITNEKFPRGMAWLANEIKREGLTPGLWLAPFLLSERSRTYAAHSDWIVRSPDGSPSVATNNWEQRNFALDCSNPDAQEWLRYLFREVCEGWGFDYVKVDFLYAGAIAGQRADPTSSRLQAYRAGLEAIRHGVGDERFILGCGSLMAPSVGVFDGNRIGPDCAPFWRFLTRQERATPSPPPRRPDDGLSTETALRNTMNRSWMHNRLWANDPDCLLVREDRSKLTLDEVRTMAAVIALSGGMVLSSDDLDKLAPDRIDLLSAVIPPLPHSAVPADLMLTDMPERFEWRAGEGDDVSRIVGLFNFSDTTRDMELSLPHGDWDVFEFWDERYRGVCSTSVTFDLVGPHASRVVCLRRAFSGPRLVGTTAHVGMGFLDVYEEARDANRLVLKLRPIGRRRRAIYVAGGNVLSAAWNGAPARTRFGGQAAAIEVDADRESELVITFEHEPVAN
jgi:alpha-galactosidase